ncbi:helix-turn-helix transcriptional regulator [Caulobacter segnis]
MRRRLSVEGTSFREILLKARMDLASTLLAQSDASVGQAAQAAGYRSRSHFARRFRKAYGLTPREIRGGD